MQIKQNNMKIVDTEYGQLLLMKGVGDDDNYTITLSMVYVTEDDIVLEPKMTLGYTEASVWHENFDKEGIEFENIAKALFGTIKEFIEDAN